MQTLTFLFIIPLFFLFNYFCTSKNFLLDNKSLLHKKKFSKKSVALLGGVLLIICFVFIFYKNNFSLLFILLPIFFLGLLADINYLKSPFSRFLIQFIIIFSFLYYFNFELNLTKVPFLDFLLSNNIFNIFFCIFCLMILINGSNFIDGINTLFIINYLAIFVILFLLPKNIHINHNLLRELIFILFILYIFNCLDLLYLGDNGSYLLSIFTGFFLINFYNNNISSISSFFVVLLLWYPCFELLFSITRRIVEKKSPFFPDSKHFHHLVCGYIEKKFRLTKPFSHILSSLSIAGYNFFSFYLSIYYILSAKKIILTIFINILLYLFVYNYLKNKVKN